MHQAVAGNEGPVTAYFFKKDKNFAKEKEKSCIYPLNELIFTIIFVEI